MNAKGKKAIKESKPSITASTLMRLAGLSAIVAGLCFIFIGMFHPLNEPSAVNATWVNVHIAATALGFFGLFGMAGLYARQVEDSGWLGLAGFLLFTGWMSIISGFSFVEAFILPTLTNESPAFIAGWMGLFSGAPSELNFGILPTLWNLSGPILIFGTLLFGIATFRARVLPRWAGALLALTAVLVPAGAVVPPEFRAKLIMIPIGLALAWLGYALFAERREQASEAVPSKVSSQLSQTEAK
jgi:hypothetical protein